MPFANPERSSIVNCVAHSTHDVRPASFAQPWEAGGVPVATGPERSVSWAKAPQAATTKIIASATASVFTPSALKCGGSADRQPGSVASRDELRPFRDRHELADSRPHL